MYIIERFGSTVLPILNVEHPQDTGGAALQLLNLPGGGAYDVLGNEQSFPGAYNYNIPCTISNRNESTLLTQYNGLRQLVGRRDKLYRRVQANNSIHWAWARLNSITGVRKYGQENHYKQDLTLNFTIMSPIWYGIAHQEAWDFDAGYYLDTGLIFDESSEYTIDLTGGSGFYIYNNGNAQVNNLTIVYTAKGSDTTDLDILISSVDPSQVSYIHYTGTIPADSELIIDCGARSVKLDGSDAYANFSLDSMHNTTEWFPLTPGAIYFGFDGAGGAANTAVFRYSDGWV
jgi:hypothetical protein